MSQDPTGSQSAAPEELPETVNSDDATETQPEEAAPAVVVAEATVPTTETTALAAEAAAIPASEAAATEAAPETQGRKRWPWVSAGVAAVVVGAYLGGAYYFADRVPAGTTIAGVDLGGLDRPSAIAALEEGVADLASAPIKVVASADGKERAINPSDYSLVIDKEASVDSVVGFSLDPGLLWAHITGGKAVDPVISYDEKQLASVVETLAKESDVAPVNAVLAYKDAKPAVTPAEKGTKLKVDEAEKILSTEVFSLAQPIALPVEDVEPTITTEAAEKAQKDLAEPLIADKVTVKIDGHSVELTPEQLAAAATFAEKDGKLALNVDGANLGDIIRKAAPEVLKPGVDATIAIVDHTTPTITPSQDGVGIDDAALAASIAEKVTGKDRTVEIAPTAVPAAFTTADAEELGIKEVVSEIETPYTSDPVRTTNLIVGTEKLTNTLVKPGETFSLEDALGPIEEEYGYVASGVVVNGFNSTAMGGGLSQLSTNMFNIGYLAGLTDVEHQPHTKYFDRYPMGREATLWEDTIDMRWTNNTPYGVMIDTWVDDDGYVHSQLWSTKYWDVETETIGPYGVVQATTKNNPNWDCEPSPPGNPGFSVTVSRTVSHDGVVNEEESGSYEWTYEPVWGVTCKK
ncbi:MAG: VanW family protein [Ancrocorticia sp.]